MRSGTGASGRIGGAAAQIMWRASSFMPWHRGTCRRPGRARPWHRVRGAGGATGPCPQVCGPGRGDPGDHCRGECMPCDRWRRGSRIATPTVRCTCRLTPRHSFTANGEGARRRPSREPKAHQWRARAAATLPGDGTPAAQGRSHVAAFWPRCSGAHRRRRVQTKRHCRKPLGKRLSARDFDGLVAGARPLVALRGGITAPGIPAVTPKTSRSG